MKGIERACYGNWVSTGLIGKCAIAMLVSGALAALVWTLWGAAAWGIVLAVVSGVCLVSGIYFIRARRLFSEEGAGVQSKILDEVITRIHWDGKGDGLDIGCGSGPLAIRLARRYEDARITGIDYWGKQWKYSQRQCESNAAMEGVGERTRFTRASASSLPFLDESFDLIVSNLVFHEVKDARDKRDPLREALRVLKKGGAFVLQDLFRLEPYFGTIDDLIEYLKSLGVREVHFEDTSEAPFIPRMLKLPFMVGTIGILYGVK